MDDIGNIERHALVDAASAFEDIGMEFPMPWECSMDDLDLERFRGLLAACRAYHKTMQGWGL